MTNPTEIARIAAGLTDAHLAFLVRVSDGGNPRGFCDRAQDRVRQKLRKIGAVAYVGKPRRWQISETGQAVAAYLKEQERG